MIEVQKLSKSYGRIKAVDDITFTVEKGEIIGFLGPNGAGKSTTMNMITGCLSSNGGSIKVCDNDVFDAPKEAKKHIGYLPEQPPLYTDLTVKEFLNFVSDLKKVDKKEKLEQMDEIMNLVKIKDVENRLINNLSKGYKQRVGIAQALIGGPEVLILDEPTVGLDPKQMVEIRKLIKALGKEHTIILSSHILPEVSAVCDRVIIINEGKIVAIDTPENLSRGTENLLNISIKIAGPEKAVQTLLEDVEGVAKVEFVNSNKKKVESDFIIESEKDIDIRKPIFRALAAKDYPILELKSLNLTLEDIFLKLTTQEKEVE
ncbi:MAG: ATP-binding cassette domain-containing protein [Clostridiales bacterium]